MANKNKNNNRRPRPPNPNIPPEFNQEEITEDRSKDPFKFPPLISADGKKPRVKSNILAAQKTSGGGGGAGGGRNREQERTQKQGQKVNVNLDNINFVAPVDSVEDEFEDERFRSDNNKGDGPEVRPDGRPPRVKSNILAKNRGKNKKPSSGGGRVPVSTERPFNFVSPTQAPFFDEQSPGFGVSSGHLEPPAPSPTPRPQQGFSQFPSFPQVREPGSKPRVKADIKANKANRGKGKNKSGPRVVPQSELPGALGRPRRPRPPTEAARNSFRPTQTPNNNNFFQTSTLLSVIDDDYEDYEPEYVDEIDEFRQPPLTSPRPPVFATTPTTTTTTTRRPFVQPQRPQRPRVKSNILANKNNRNRNKSKKKQKVKKVRGRKRPTSSKGISNSIDDDEDPCSNPFKCPPTKTADGRKPRVKSNIKARRRNFFHPSTSRTNRIQGRPRSKNTIPSRNVTRRPPPRKSRVKSNQNPRRGKAQRTKAFQKVTNDLPNVQDDEEEAGFFDSTTEQPLPITTTESLLQVLLQQREEEQRLQAEQQNTARPPPLIPVPSRRPQQRPRRPQPQRQRLTTTPRPTTTRRPRPTTTAPPLRIQPQPPQQQQGFFEEQPRSQQQNRFNNLQPAGEPELLLDLAPPLPQEQPPTPTQPRPSPPSRFQSFVQQRPRTQPQQEPPRPQELLQFSRRPSQAAFSSPGPSPTPPGPTRGGPTRRPTPRPVSTTLSPIGVNNEDYEYEYYYYDDDDYYYDDEGDYPEEERRQDAARPANGQQQQLNTTPEPFTTSPRSESLAQGFSPNFNPNPTSNPSLVSDVPIVTSPVPQQDPVTLPPRTTVGDPQFPPIPTFSPEQLFKQRIQGFKVKPPPGFPSFPRKPKSQGLKAKKNKQKNLNQIKDDSDFDDEEDLPSTTRFPPRQRPTPVEPSTPAPTVETPIATTASSPVTRRKPRVKSNILQAAKNNRGNKKGPRQGRFQRPGRNFGQLFNSRNRKRPSLTTTLPPEEEIDATTLPPQSLNDLANDNDNNDPEVGPEVRPDGRSPRVKSNIRQRLANKGFKNNRRSSVKVPVPLSLFGDGGPPKNHEERSISSGHEEEKKALEEDGPLSKADAIEINQSSDHEPVVRPDGQKPRVKSNILASQRQKASKIKKMLAETLSKANETSNDLHLDLPEVKPDGLKPRVKSNIRASQRAKAAKIKKMLAEALKANSDNNIAGPEVRPDGRKPQVKSNILASHRSNKAALKAALAEAASKIDRPPLKQPEVRPDGQRPRVKSNILASVGQKGQKRLKKKGFRHSHKVDTATLPPFQPTTLPPLPTTTTIVTSAETTPAPSVETITTTAPTTITTTVAPSSSSTQATSLLDVFLSTQVLNTRAVDPTLASLHAQHQQQQKKGKIRRKYKRRIKKKDLREHIKNINKNSDKKDSSSGEEAKKDSHPGSGAQV